MKNEKIEKNKIKYYKSVFFFLCPFFASFEVTDLKAFECLWRRPAVPLSKNTLNKYTPFWDLRICVNLWLLCVCARRSFLSCASPKCVYIVCIVIIFSILVSVMTNLEPNKHLYDSWKEKFSFEKFSGQKYPFKLL